MAVRAPFRLEKAGFDGHTVHHQSPPFAHTSRTSLAVFIVLIRFIATPTLLLPQPVEPISETHIRLEDSISIGPDVWLGDCGPKALVEVGRHFESDVRGSSSPGNLDCA